MPAPQIILDLIERFERNKEAYKSGAYNETQVRREFIDPFFQALGWDVNNEAGNAEAYKDVIHEDAVKVGGVTKAPDYSFRIGGQRKFFVEAKQPSINIKDTPAPAYQVRRYAWSAKLPLSIVTDFDEFAVYDCRVKPDQSDRADKARILYYTYKQYDEKWDEIAGIFSKDAILKGSFDKYAEFNKGKRGTAEVDSAFLAEIESWREMLARNIALRNTLSVRELNDAVQRTIDRIIFLRIAEDRGIEEYGSLRGLCNGNNAYARLRELFYKADDRYNSGLFHFRHEKNEAEPPDNLTTSLTIDDKPLKDILKRLYYPDSPYEFSVLPADILGQVYEQLLGKVIRLTSDHRAIVEDKPEVKKAGGVFYTPTYIVDYIVKNTVGKLLEGKNPKKAESLRILDPACGSGSFLLGAYQYLLDWHLRQYVVDGPEKHIKAKRPALYSGQGGAWHLTTAERKRILLNNIYGVDIDSQAVEVTKLSLLLKVLEDETDETLNQQRKLFHERALPDLGGNIKCGNSLIGPDFYDGKQIKLMDTEEAQRVNVFDWQAEFPDIFKAGGFDAVIGNPPYVRPHNLLPEDKTYFWATYKTFTHKSDIYCCFIEQSMSILRIGGLFSFIVSHGWLRLNSFQELRGLILNKSKIKTLVELPFRVFKNAVVDTGIFVLERGDADSSHKLTVVEGNVYNGLPRFIEKKKLLQSAFQKTFQNVFDLSILPETESIKDKMRKGDSLGKFYYICFGLKTAADDKFLHFSKGLHKEDKPLLRGDDIKRYDTKYKGEFVWYVPEKMRLNKSTARPGEPARFQQPKILVKDTSKYFGCTYDADGFYVKDVLIVIPKPEVKVPFDLQFVTGLLNSHLMSFYYRTTFPTLHVQNEELASLPLPTINSVDRAVYERMVRLVDQMLALHKQLTAAKTGHEQTLIQRQINATDKQIDKLVYELYDLTPEEIAIVEGAP